jgi:hypothetical protein
VLRLVLARVEDVRLVVAGELIFVMLIEDCDLPVAPAHNLPASDLG